MPYKLNKETNKNLKLKIVLDSIRLKISDHLYLECPIGRLKPATFMFLRKDAVDFVSRFSIQLNDTFENLKKSKKKTDDVDLGTFLNNQINLNNSNNERKRKDKVLLNCKWLSSDFSREFGNLTLYLNKPRDNPAFNDHLFKYFDAKQDHSLDVPKIIRSANKVLKRRIGEKVHFYCNANQAEIKINWYRKDENDFINLNDELKTNKHALDITNYRITFNRLTIREIQDNDFVEYICRANNDYGEDYMSYKLENCKLLQNYFEN